MGKGERKKAWSPLDLRIIRHPSVPRRGKLLLHSRGGSLLTSVPSPLYLTPWLTLTGALHVITTCLYIRERGICWELFPPKNHYRNHHPGESAGNPTPIIVLRIVLLPHTQLKLLMEKKKEI